MRLLLNADLGSPVWLQLACVPWMCELLVPLSSILGPSNPAPGPCPAQPTPLCPGPQQGVMEQQHGYQPFRQTGSRINEEVQEREWGAALSFAQELCHLQMSRNDWTGLHYGQAPACLTSPQTRAVAFLGRKA